MQRSLFFIKQNSIKACIIDVSRANRDVRQAGAFKEGALPDTGNTVRNNNLCQIAASKEGVVTNAANSFAFNYRRNRYRTRCLTIAASDGDRITFNLIL